MLAFSKGKPAIKRPAKKETAKDEDETVEMLEGEEEEVVVEDELVDPKKARLTKEALQDHNEFIRACKEGNLTAKLLGLEECG